jgi:hypothetical protein
MTESYMMQLDRFDLAAALHWYCVDNHDGQSSDLYRMQCELNYTPSVYERGPRSDDASDVYSELALGNVDAETVLRIIQTASDRED